MPYLALCLSYLFPALLFLHAVSRLFKAGAENRKLLATTPAIGFAFATLWLAASVAAQMDGGMSAAAQEAQVKVGPMLFLAVLLMVEGPFWVHWWVFRGKSSGLASQKKGARK